MIIYKAFTTEYKLLTIYLPTDEPSVEIANDRGEPYIKSISEIIEDVYFDRDGTGHSMSLTFTFPYSENESDIMYEFIHTLFTTH